MTDTRIDSLRAVRAAQREIVSEVIHDDVSRILVLAPVGSGKSSTAVGAAMAVLQSDPSASVLFLLPSRVLAESYQTRIGGEPLELFSRQRLREAIAAGKGKLPNGRVVYVPTKLAVQPEFRDVLVDTAWSLVVVDEAQSMTANAINLVRRLLDPPRVRALVLAQGDLNALPTSRLLSLPFSAAHVWHLDAPTQAGANVYIHEFRRTPEEVEVLRDARRLRRALGKVMGAAESGPGTDPGSTLYSLAQELLVLVEAARRRRNTLAHFSIAPDSTSIEQQGTLGELSRLVSELERTLDRIDALPRDSNVDALLRVLQRLPSDRATIVFVNDDDSASYLSFAAREVRAGTEAITQSDTPDRRDSKLGPRTRVLIVTDQVAAGYEFSRFTAAVHFDFPKTLSAWEGRNARLGRFDRPEELDLHVLVPEDTLRDPHVRDLLQRIVPDAM
jgi:hypothetical protein